MLLSEYTEVKWNNFTKRYYLEKGYKFTKLGETFLCKVEDLQLKSTALVDVKCDYCGIILSKKFHNYTKNKEYVNKDCCTKCRNKKQEEVIKSKYSVENINQLEEMRNKSSERMRTPIEEVLTFCEEKGLDVLNIQDYKSDRTRLKIICEKHFDKGIQETNFANIKSSKHCCKFIKHETSSHRRKNGELVYQDFVDFGFIPKFSPNEYVNNCTPLPFICPFHKDKGIQYREYSNLKNTKGCLYCSFERRNSSKRNNQETVFKEMKSVGLIPLENEKYINKDTPIKYRCEKHPEEVQHLYYGTFKRVIQHCDFCRTQENISKLNRKLRSSISKWRKAVEKECGFKCVITGSDEYDVHHLYSFNTIIENVVSELGIEIKDTYSSYEYKIIKDRVVDSHYEEMGICVHPLLHIEFHKIYGKSNNTPEQFKEFQRLYLNKDIEEVG